MKIRVTTYRAAPPKCWRLARNRYYVGTAWEQTIGIGVQFGSRALGLTWRSPKAMPLPEMRKLP
jgi:hypothetical protein